MRAVVVRELGPSGGIAVEVVPDPVPGKGEVLVDVEAIDTNYPDVLVVSGRYQVRPPLPFVPGKAATGRVSALGAGATGLKVGQRVAVQVEHGAYAEKLCAPVAHCYPVPADITAVEAAAALLTYQTAWFALTDRARLAAGETVLVLGASGGVGTAALQLAKALGARTIAASRGTGKRDVLEACGADAIVDLSQPNLADSLRRQIHDATGGAGVDVVLDPIGGEAFAAALRCLAWRGRYVVVGFAGGDIPVVRTNYLLVKTISVLGLQASDYRDRRPAEAAMAQAEIFRLMTEDRFRPIIDRTLPLESFGDALERLESGSARGQIVLTTGLAPT